MTHHACKDLAAALLALGLASAGCAAGPLTPEPPTPAELEAGIAADLDALRALDVVEVGGLVMRLPTEATACYGLPCNDADRARWTAERQAQAARLAELAAQATDAAEDAAATAPPPAEVEAAVAALRDLQIVEVGALIHAEPASQPECYNLPCPSDVAAAEAANARRAAAVVAIAARVR